MTQTEPQVQVVARATKRRWVAVGVITVVFALAGAAYVFLRPSSYSSNATVLIQPLAGNAFTTTAAANSQSSAVAMQTEAGLVDSRPVTERVNAALGTTLTVGSSRVTASVRTNTQLIRISYSGATAQLTQRYANAFANGYLNYRAGLAAARQKAQLASLNSQATKIAALLKAAEAKAAQPDPPANAAPQVQAFTSNLVSIQSSITAAEAPPGAPGTIVSPAGLPGQRSPLYPALVIVGAAVLGLIIAITLAYWRERRDDRIRAVEETSIMGIPVLGVLAHRTSGARGTATTLDPDEADAFRRARTGVLAAAPRPSVIAISVVSETEAGAYLAVQLARTIAAAGYRVTLMDAVISGNHVGPLLGLDEVTGLSDLLLGAQTVDTVELSEVDRVQVLAAGTDPLGARERYSGAQFEELLAQLRAEADYVLVSAGPVSTGDGLAVVASADSVALIAADHATTHSQIALAADQSSRLGVPVLGLFVVPARHRRTRRDPVAEQIWAQPSADAAPAAQVEQRSGTNADNSTTSDARATLRRRVGRRSAVQP